MRMATKLRVRSASALLLLLLLAGVAAAGHGQDRRQEPQKHYGLLFGTAYGPDDLPLYGARVEIHPAGKGRPNWELISDHRGEFAQRVPPGPADYLVTGQAEMVDAQTHKKKRLKGEARIHLDGEERQDFSLHLN